MEETIIFPDSDSGESASSSGDSGDRPKGKAFPIRENDKVTRLRVCVSAQDLRSFIMEERIKGTGEECSPRGVLEDCMRSSESETSNSKASTSSPEAPATPCVSSHWQRLFRLWRPRSMRRLATFPPLGVPKPPKRHTRSVREGQGSTKPFLDDAQYFCFKPSWKNFTLAEIRAATNNFSSENIIGLGGYAKVYRGCLQNGQLVAIKRLTRGTTEEKIGDFLSELGIIVHINHPNAAKLIGYGVEGGMFLVLKLSPHGSLASRLHGSKEKPDWSIRYKVALGTAEGIQYFHEGCPRRIIHRDIKAANILLAEDFEPEICDFGLAKWLPEQWTHHTVLKFEGTFGYLAPEYIMHGIVDEKTDVFAFGVLVLELITGRKALDSSQQSLVMWAKPLLDKNDMRQLVDPSLKDDYDAQQMNYLALAASLCTQRSPILRPRISEVVLLLRGEVSLESMKLSERMLLQRTQSEELSDGEEYNSMEYLNDLNRYKQLALEV